LITGILLDTVNDKNFFKTFYARRTLRIFPLYYGFLFFVLLLTPLFHLQWNGWQYYYLTYTANLVLWRHEPLEIGANIHHFWSLNVEEQFYMVWPFLVYRVRNLTTLLRIALIGSAIVLLIRIGLVLLHLNISTPYITYAPTFSCADNLLYGCAVAILFRSKWKQMAQQMAPRVFAACATIFIALSILVGKFDFTNPIVCTFGFSIVGVMFAALVAVSLNPVSWASGFFSSSILRFFGRYSYGLYVYHYSIDGFLVPILRPWLAVHLGSKAVAVIGTAAVSTCISILVAVLSYHLFEVYFLKLKKFFSYQTHSK
jgi:peptidoglycan/LPS O-acetylase OafA/YrhL